MASHPLSRFAVRASWENRDCVETLIEHGRLVTRVVQPLLEDRNLPKHCIAAHGSRQGFTHFGLPAHARS